LVVKRAGAAGAGAGVGVGLAVRDGATPVGVADAAALNGVPVAESPGSARVDPPSLVTTITTKAATEIASTVTPDQINLRHRPPGLACRITPRRLSPCGRRVAATTMR
jgi:hypothetical protein